MIKLNLEKKGVDKMNTSICMDIHLPILVSNLVCNWRQLERIPKIAMLILQSYMDIQAGELFCAT